MAANFTPIDFLLTPVPAPSSPQQVSAGTVERPIPIQKTEVSTVDENQEEKEPQEERESSENQNKTDDFMDVHQEVPVIPQDVADAGVAVSPTATASLQPVLKLPLEDVKIEEGLKAPTSSGLRWLAEFCLYLLKQTHFTLKKVHGKMMRVKT